MHAEAFGSLSQGAVPWKCACHTKVVVEVAEEDEKYDVSL